MQLSEASTGVSDFLGSRPFAGACFGNSFGAMNRIIRRFIAVSSPDVSTYAFVPSVHLVGVDKEHLSHTYRVVP